MTRTPEDVFADHSTRLATQSLDLVVENYPEDAVLVTPSETLYGRAGVKVGLAALLDAVPHAEWKMQTRFVGNVLLLTWSAESEFASIRKGVDTFVFANGFISAQTVVYSVEDKIG